jgi:DNA replication licensing factor MCM2
MRLSDYVGAGDIDRAIAVTIDSFVGSQKLSSKKALARAFAKYVLSFLAVFSPSFCCRPA